MILKIIICVCVATVIGLVVFQFVDPNIGNNNTHIVDSDTENKNKITIGITGQVSKPGDYIFDTKSPTMEDLIGKAGGINTNGDERCFYLEAKVENNISYYIPPKYDTTNICNDQPIKKVNINGAQKEELLTIMGFGDALATSLLSYREANGIFYTIESIMKVNGIGNAKFNTCKNYIILHE